MSKLEAKILVVFINLGSIKVIYMEISNSIKMKFLNQLVFSL